MKTDTENMTCFTPVDVDPGMKVELKFGKPFMTIQSTGRQPCYWFTPASLFGVTYRRRIGTVDHAALAVVEALPFGLAGDQLPCVSGFAYVHTWLAGAEGSQGYAAAQRACRFIDEVSEGGTNPANVRASYYRVVGAMLRPAGMPSRYDLTQAGDFLEADLLCGLS